MRGRTGAVLLRASPLESTPSDFVVHVAEDASFSWSAIDFVKGNTGRHEPIPGNLQFVHHLTSPIEGP